MNIVFENQCQSTSANDDKKFTVVVQLVRNSNIPTTKIENLYYNAYSYLIPLITPIIIKHYEIN